MVEPAQVVAASMAALLCIGLMAQLMRQQGGAMARATPIVILGLLIFVSAAMMAVLQRELYALPEWEVASSRQSLDGIGPSHDT